MCISHFPVYKRYTKGKQGATKPKLSGFYIFFPNEKSERNKNAKQEAYLRGNHRSGNNGRRRACVKGIKGNP